MRALFISDLHLSASDAVTTARFERFMQSLLISQTTRNTQSAQAASQGIDALFFLGDIFDAWVGDDQLDHDPFARQIASVIAKNCAAGIKTYLLGGNRDFMLGERFATVCGATLLPSQIVIVLDGKRVLLMHGDELCTDDVAYQHLRQTMTRNISWCAKMAQQPFAVRRALALKLLDQSATEKEMKSAAIMDVNANAVADSFVKYGVTTMIHGHTHRPGQHQWHINGADYERIVLSDWQQDYGYLVLQNAALSIAPWV